MKVKKFVILILCLIGSLSVPLALKTSCDLKPIPASLSFGDSEVRKPQLLDRFGNPLSISYQNRWSVQTVPLYEIPAILRNAFIESEDRRFPSHGGVDLLARAHALVQNLRAMRGVRGASTITEQVVRMLHARPRTVWSRWLEGIEAARLEKRFSKSEILEFYLNQVPYGHRRRGVVEAARFYFDRDPATLNVKECLALAVLVRAPSGLDLRQRNRSVEKRLSKLAKHMREKGLLSEDEFRAALTEGFEFAHSRRVIEAPQFVQHVFSTVGAEILDSNGTITTSLDGPVQQKIRQILRNCLEALKSSDVGDGAALVADNRSGDVLAWVSESTSAGESQGWVDAVTVRRQPGSTLKPFLYSLAIEMGWTAATLIEDSPLSEAAGPGLHSFHNYSRIYYGPVRLRVALGNSLNTPAVRTIQFTGTERLLNRLHILGITGLDKSAEFYGHGLALGDGEVSLFELVQAYSALARHGSFLPLRTLSGRHMPTGEIRPVIDPAAAAIICDILSDPQARRLEFGEGHLLRFPVLTAVKTGTSTDHRDCWAVGISDRYTAGVWMGNLDHRPTKGVTGAIGPALVLRAIFAELDRDGEVGSFSSWPGLESRSICAVSGMLAGPDCPSVDEKFEPGKTPVEVCPFHSTAGLVGAGLAREVESGWVEAQGLARREASRAEYDSKAGAAPICARPSPAIPHPLLREPSPGLQIAVDPRIPAELQAFAFRISEEIEPEKIEWVLNGKPVGETGKNEHRFLWPLSRGEYILRARVWVEGQNDPVETPHVAFVVK